MRLPLAISLVLLLAALLRTAGHDEPASDFVSTTICCAPRRCASAASTIPACRGSPATSRRRAKGGWGQPFGLNEDPSTSRSRAGKSDRLPSISRSCPRTRKPSARRPASSSSARGSTGLPDAPRNVLVYIAVSSKYHQRLARPTRSTSCRSCPGRRRRRSPSCRVEAPPIIIGRASQIASTPRSPVIARLVPAVVLRHAGASRVDDGSPLGDLSGRPPVL